ncbi:hypothetical protein [Methylomonas koyamae]|uniref:DUF2489 domain-containing protein n=1 Tax=Methylomonas koyamae TaxID=702114 RepID=A0AA91DH79_9GAMM|nr:hypothetical protein [Methylomonas koyamae]OAI29487.1 hypothetical protein A1356_03915 [Methylomonas koyamae]
MNSTWIILILANTLAVSLIALAVLLLARGREKKRRQAEIEELLAEIKDRQERRGDRLQLALIEKYRFGEEAAHSVAEVLMLAEKQFLYQFVEQLLGRQPLAGCYLNLCDLLDSYLNGALAAAHPPANAAAPSAVEPAAGNAAAAAGAETELPPPPDWGDVFD